MSLDCQTRKGKVFIEYQMKCIRQLEYSWNAQIIPTVEDESADIDALAVKNNRISAILEVKSRNMALDQLYRFGSYLITSEKLSKMSRLSLSLRVPSFLAVYLIKDNNIVYWKVSDLDGKLILDYKDRITTTQTTCNGGQIDRCNAYISLNDMKIINLCI